MFDEWVGGVSHEGENAGNSVGFHEEITFARGKNREGTEEADERVRVVK
jgi:hypothetical protein